MLVSTYCQVHILLIPASILNKIIYKFLYNLCYAFHIVFYILFTYVFSFNSFDLHYSSQDLSKTISLPPPHEVGIRLLLLIIFTIQLLQSHRDNILPLSSNISTYCQNFPSLERHGSRIFSLQHYKLHLR